MRKIERIREVVAGTLPEGYLEQKAADGWKLVALEWRREIDAPEDDGQRSIEEPPYGYRVAPDCRHLEEDPFEQRVLAAAIDLIGEDKPLSVVAADLNRRGFRTRGGSDWSPVAVFNMLPRIIESGPRIFASSEWRARPGART